MQPEIIVSDSPSSLAERVAADFADRVQRVLAEQDRFTVALTGGQTPKLFYQRLAQEPYRSSIPWGRLVLFWGDERCVPKDHPDSNFGMAEKTLLQHVPVKPQNVYRMRGEEAPPVAAREYENRMREVFGSQAAWPRFDLIFLGMGSDGHVASLMAGTPALEASLHEGGQGADRWVVGNVVRALQTVRITLTLPVLNQARRVWFLATGLKKAETFARAQEGPAADCPASLVQPADGELCWYVDQAVAGGENAYIRMRPWKKS